MQPRKAKKPLTAEFAENPETAEKTKIFLAVVFSALSGLSQRSLRLKAFDCVERQNSVQLHKPKKPLTAEFAENPPRPLRKPKSFSAWFSLRSLAFLSGLCG